MSEFRAEQYEEYALRWKSDLSTLLLTEVKAAQLCPSPGHISLNPEPD